MQMDLQTVDGRLIERRSSALQQLHNQLLGFFEVTAQKLALRAFEPQAERQLVAGCPSPVSSNSAMPAEKYARADA